eukprot:4618839-Pyramimonas_sp.AAC.1
MSRAERKREETRMHLAFLSLLTASVGKLIFLLILALCVLPPWPLSPARPVRDARRALGVSPALDLMGAPYALA